MSGVPGSWGPLAASCLLPGQAGEITGASSLEAQRGPKALPLAPRALSPYPVSLCSSLQLAQCDLGQARGCECF